MSGAESVVREADASMGTGVAPEPRVPALEELPQLAKLLVCGLDAERLEAAAMIHRFVSVAAAERDAHIDRVVSAGVVASLVEALGRTADPKIHLEIVESFGNVACRDVGNAVCITAQVPAALCALVGQHAKQGCTKVANGIAAAFSSIARTVNGHEACIEAGAPAAIVALAGLAALKSNLGAVASVMQALDVLTRRANGLKACVAAHAPTALIQLVELPIVQASSVSLLAVTLVFSNIAASADGRASCIGAFVPEALVCLLRLPAVWNCAGTADQVAKAIANFAICKAGLQAFLASDAPAALIELACHQAAEGDTEALENIDAALGNMSNSKTGRAITSTSLRKYLGTQFTIDVKVFTALRNFLYSCRGVLRMGACERLASILDNSPTKMQAVVDAGIFPILIMVAGKHWSEPQFFACRALLLIIENGTLAHVNALVQHSALDTLMAVVQECNQCSEVALVAIAGILSVGAKSLPDSTVLDNNFMTGAFRAKLGPVLRRIARAQQSFNASSSATSTFVSLARLLLAVHFPALPCALCLGQFEELSLPFPEECGHDHGQASACVGCLHRFVETGVANARSGAAPASHLLRCWAWASGCGARLTADDLAAAGVPAALVLSFRTALVDTERAAAVRRAAAANGDLCAVFSAEEVAEFAALVRAAPDRWTVCPGCFARIERTAGCDHVSHECAAGMHTDFCFCCGERTTNPRCPTPHIRLFGLITLEPSQDYAPSLIDDEMSNIIRHIETVLARNARRFPHQQPSQPPLQVPLVQQPRGFMQLLLQAPPHALLAPQPPRLLPLERQLQLIPPQVYSATDSDPQPLSPLPGGY